MLEILDEIISWSSTKFDQNELVAKRHFENKWWSERFWHCSILEGCTKVAKNYHSKLATTLYESIIAWGGHD